MIPLTSYPFIFVSLGPHSSHLSHPTFDLNYYWFGFGFLHFAFKVEHMYVFDLWIIAWFVPVLMFACPHACQFHSAQTAPLNGKHRK